jgi:hypothetical protein
MATYQIQINERTLLGKGVIALLQSIPQAVTLKRTRVKTATEQDAKFNLYDSLDRAFADVKLMIDGKKREKTLDELIDELQNSND